MTLYAHSFLFSGIIPSLVPILHPLHRVVLAGSCELCYILGFLPFCVTMVSVDHLHSSSLSNHMVAEMKHLISQKSKMA